MKNKIIAFLAVLVFSAQMIQVGTVYSENDSADSGAVKLLTALGIMDIDSSSGKFWDDTPVKRREMAQILCNLFRLEATRDAVPRFNDVQEEYRGYVETVVRNGYMNGYNDERFGANDYITENQLLKIFVTVLGGGTMAESSGGFPMGYIYVARRLGLTADTGAGGEQLARRIDVANMIYSALETDVVKLVSMNERYSTYTTIEGYTFLSETLDIYRYEGIVNKNEATALDDPSGAGEGLVQIGDTLHKDEERLTSDYLGSYVVAYVHIPRENELGSIISVTEGRKNETIVIENENFISVDGFRLDYYEGEKKKSLTLSPGINMIYNGKATEYDPAKFTMDIGNIKLVNNNGDGMYDVVLITSYETFVAEKVNTVDEIIETKHGKASIDLNGNFYTVLRNGVSVELNKIGVGEVILAAVSEGADGEKVIKINACSSRVTDMVDKLFSDTDGEYAEIAGKVYKISTYCKALMQSGILPKLNVGDEAQFFADSYGNIVYFNLNTTGKKIGYLVRAVLGDEPFNTKLRVTIYNESGSFEELTASGKLEINGEKTELSSVSTEIKDKLQTSGLVEYSQTEGELTSLTFASDGYDVSTFSLDDSHEKKGSYIRCTATSMLDNKYKVTASTKLFIVPTGTKDIMESAYYYIKTGSYFKSTWNYNVYLYDISESGEVRCAMIKQSPLNASSLRESDSILAVAAVEEAVNEDGEVVPVICGLDESGKEKEVMGTGAESIKVTVGKGEAAVSRDVKMGDVIQYVTDSSGRLAAVKVVHAVDSGSSFYEPEAVETSKTNYTVTKAYGQVIRAAASQIFLSCNGLWENMTPLDTDMLISNTGNAVYLYDSERGKLSPAGFGDANRGDSVFGCVNSSNKTRMLIIYR